MYKEYIFKSGSKEWLDIRSKHITGTEIASLFALNPYKSAVQIMKEKIAGKSEPVTDNDHMKRGRRAELGILISANELGIEAQPAAPWGHVKVLTKDGISVSLDAMCGDIPVEIKSTHLNFAKYQDGIISQAYLLQCQAQLLVLGCKKLLLICGEQSPLYPIVAFKVKPNKELHKIMIDTVERFSHNRINEEKFKVNQDDKKRVLELLETTVEWYDV
jgi:predicted phage-related endonuclease